MIEGCMHIVFVAEVFEASKQGFVPRRTSSTSEEVQICFYAAIAYGAKIRRADFVSCKVTLCGQVAIHPTSCDTLCPSGEGAKRAVEFSPCNGIHCCWGDVSALANVSTSMLLCEQGV